MKIAIAIESFFDGGAEMFAIRLANALAEFHTVFFIEVFPERTVAKRQLNLLNRQKVILFQPRLKSKSNAVAKKSSLRQLRFLDKRKRSDDESREQQIKRFIKKNSIGVVNSHSWDSDEFFATLKKKATFSLISSFHGHYEFLNDKRPDFEARTRYILFHTDIVVYTTPLHCKTLDNYSFPNERRKKIFYGFESDPVENITVYEPGERLRLVMVARGIEEKGWKEAINALKNISEKFANRLELLLVGEGDHLNFLKRQNEHAEIRFAGYLQEVSASIANAHVGLLPTYYAAESLPNAIIEYLLMGKPVIATKIGAIDEMITAPDGKKAGFCLPLEGHKLEVSSLENAIEEYLISPELVAIHSELSLKAARKFGMKACVESYLNVIQKVGSLVQTSNEHTRN